MSLCIKTHQDMTPSPVRRRQTKGAGVTGDYTNGSPVNMGISVAPGREEKPSGEICGRCGLMLVVI